MHRFRRVSYFSFGTIGLGLCGLFSYNGVSAVCNYVFRSYGEICQVTGQSMKPTLNPDSDILGDQVWVYRKPVQVSKGDVVTLASPKDENELLIKRVVGVEGDIVIPRSGYPSALEVPKGHFWVEGDNALLSEDSNHFGPVPVDLIIGKAICIIWPITRLGKIVSEIPSERGPVCVNMNNER